MPESTYFSSIRSRLLWCQERRVETTFQRFRSAGSGPTLCWLILEGGGSVSYDDEEITVKAGQWLFLRDAVGQQNLAADTFLVSIRFSLTLGTGEKLFDRPMDRVFPSRDHPQLEVTARALAAMIPYRQESILVNRNQFTLAENFRIESAFQQWLAAYTETMRSFGVKDRQEELRDPRVDRALELIEAHPLHKKFDVRHLAQICGLSVNQLSRLFSQTTGESIRERFEKRRLEWAKHALQDTVLPIKQISFELGFSNPSHFSSWYRDREGCTPRFARNAAK